MSTPSAGPLPEGSKVKLSVTKGLRVGKTYSLKEGASYVGRKGPLGIDVDLTEQEMPGVAVQQNRFALIWVDKNGVGIADTGTRPAPTSTAPRSLPANAFPSRPTTFSAGARASCRSR